MVSDNRKDRARRTCVPASAQGSESLPDGSDSKFTIGQHVGLSYHEVLHKYLGYHPWGKEQKSPSKGLAHLLDWATDNYEVDGESYWILWSHSTHVAFGSSFVCCTQMHPLHRSGKQCLHSDQDMFGLWALNRDKVCGCFSMQRTPWNTQTSEFGPRRTSKFTARFFCKQCGAFVDEMLQAEAWRRRQLRRDCSSSFICLRSSQYQRTRLHKSLLRMERLCSSAPSQRTSRLPRLLRRMSQGTTCQSGDHEASTAWGQEAATASSAKRGW